MRKSKELGKKIRNKSSNELVIRVYKKVARNLQKHTRNVAGTKNQCMQKVA